jgi:hypothetical protein
MWKFLSETPCLAPARFLLKAVMWATGHMVTESSQIYCSAYSASLIPFCLFIVANVWTADCCKNVHFLVSIVLSYNADFLYTKI